ncbi:MAG: cysteine desulfurase family protein [Phycisphaerae bacterium]
MTDSLIYLDNNATTPMDPRVFEAIKPYFLEQFGNAASRHHRLGCQAAQAVETARRQVADVIGADPREIIFTSGATESVNLAIQGAAASKAYARKSRHIVTAHTEHPAVLDTCRQLARNGFDITFLPVDSQGCLDLDRLTRCVTDQTLLVSIMHANNEIGLIHPIAEVGRICRERGVLFHTDATQSFGKEPLDVRAAHIDLLSLSAHKIYGPKGVGALYVRRAGPRVRCQALIHGGGHERGLRSGTLNVPGIVGLGAAAKLCQQEMHAEQHRIRQRRDHLQSALFSRIQGVVLNGHAQDRLANTLNVSFDGVDGDDLMQAMPDVALSSSSACTSAQLQPSHVLGAMGASDQRMQQSVRISLGRFTTAEQIEHTIKSFESAVAQCRQSC